MADQERPSTSSVREAMYLASAAEELLADSTDPAAAATYVGTIADAAKGLARYQLDDVLEHVRSRADRVAETRYRGWLRSADIEVDTLVDVEIDEQDDDPRQEPLEDAASGDETAGRDARHASAVDDLVGEPDTPDPDELRARIHPEDPA